MKHKLFLALVCAMICLSFCSCAVRTEVNREALNARYITEHDSPEYDYVQYVDGDDGETYVTVYERIVHYSESYEIQYRITYDNGSVETVWETVSEDEYKKYDTPKD